MRSLKMELECLLQSVLVAPAIGLMKRLAGIPFRDLE